MMKVATAALCAVLVGCFGALAAHARPHEMESNRDVIADGEAIAQKQCSTCHAIGLTGLSPRPQAPPFREIGRRYHFPALAQELDAGVRVGHPPMPRFQFTPRGTDALLAYLRRLQALDRRRHQPAQ